MAYNWSKIVRVVVRPYPTYLCRRERMNISSTVYRRICRRALLVRSYSLKSAEAVLKSYRSLVIWAPVELAGMMGTEPGLTGTMKGMDDKVL